jgi:general secretion pathway protein E
MGVENYLMTSSLVAVLAQRLVRMICEECRTEAGEAHTPDGELIPVYRGAGCGRCFGGGFYGRVGIFELMEMSEELRGLIMHNEDATKITACARRGGMRSLREDGWLKVRRGVTTPEEVTRVTQEF